ncbi:hypothetical protein [Actinacidiphila sp. bgisy160]|uniref:hypothetical protein n=1 Tax=Actinacidiphila sp. bgisy160 TaxID=3413796 RepID=UPI003D72C00C
MTDLVPVEGGGKLHVGWFMPPFFHELPVDTDDPDEGARRLVATAKEVLANGSEDEQMRMALLYASIMGDLRDAGACYAGFCVLDMDGRNSTATVAVYRTPLPEETTAAEAVPEMLAAFSRAYPEDDVQVSELPCGRPGVVRIGSAPFDLPAELSPSGEAVAVDRGLIQVYVPLPNDAEMVTFELSTPSMEDWDLYSELFAEIVRGLDWGTEEEVALATALEQVPAPQEPPAPEPEVARGLYDRSSRFLDALGVRGRMDRGNELTAVTCPDCWGKGLRSACSARHRWRIDEVEEALLAPAVARVEAFAAQGGWTVADAAGLRLTVHEEGEGAHRVTVTAVAGEGRITVEVLAPCHRTVRPPSGSAFG